MCGVPRSSGMRSYANRRVRLRTGLLGSRLCLLLTAQRFLQAHLLPEEVHRRDALLDAGIRPDHVTGRRATARTRAHACLRRAHALRRRGKAGAAGFVLTRSSDTATARRWRHDIVLLPGRFGHIGILLLLLLLLLLFPVIF